MNQTVFLTLEEARCYKCGVVFGIEAGHHEKLKRTHAGFFCTNGHEQYYTGKSEAEKLRDEVTRKQAALDQAWARLSDKSRELEAARRSNAAVKGALTKVKKRVAGGVCPCCNRYFSALHRHMTTQHPDQASA